METYRRPTSEDVARHYDEMGALYATLWDGDIHVGVWLDEDDDASLAEAQARLTEMFVERTPVGPGQRVLDVGCGTGQPALRLAEATGCEVVGITVSGTQVAKADERRARSDEFAGRVRFEQADAMDLPFAAASFDAVWALESILHVPDRTRVLCEIERVLEPGGRLVLADVVNEVPLTDEEEALFFPALAVSSLTRIEDYPGQLREAGLEPVEVIDLSRQITKTIAKTMALMESRKQELLRFYDEDFVDTLAGAWSTISKIHDSKMGYVLIVGEKPA